MRILVIDDEFAALKKLEVLLSKHGDCDAATNAKQAKEMFAQAIKEGKPYDLITIDIGLPDASGLELLKLFSSLESRNSKLESKKIMVTGSADADDVLDASKYCNGYITKPIKKEVLSQKLKQLGIEKG
ncbi:MAG: response regulator [Desulfobacteraceae bacterium]|jgi:two-component system, chemotaxis family, chemotaxis protein CheY